MKLMKKIIRYLIKKACTTLLGDCYLLITCSKEVDAKGQPFQWHALTNIGDITSARIICGYALAKLKTAAEQDHAVEEVNHILTVKK